MNDKTITQEEIREIYKHTNLSAFYNALAIQAALRESRIEDAFVPGAIYEAGRRAGIQEERKRRRGELVDPDPELIKEIYSVQSKVRSDKTKEKLCDQLAAVNKYAEEGGCPSDLVLSVVDYIAAHLMACAREACC